MSVESTAKAISKMQVGEDDVNTAAENNVNASAEVATQTKTEGKA